MQTEAQEAEAIAEAAAVSVAESMAAKGSNRGTGTKYALMTTLEEDASIDAIEDLVVNKFLSDHTPNDSTHPVAAYSTRIKQLQELMK